MGKKVDNIPRSPEGGGMTRRQVIVGAAVVALASQIPGAAKASALTRSRRAASRPAGSSDPVRRYMAAVAVLGDGRLLLTGGYDRPGKPDSRMQALNSAVIFDPVSGQWSSAASMRLPRARHAAVTLPDGRVAVLGGMGMGPTDSVEIYDPATDRWTGGTPMAQPRYDHTAAVVGNQIYVLGGSSQSILSSVEVVRPDATSPFAPRS